MPTDEKMTIDDRYNYLRMMKKRYRLSNHVERSRLLDEMEQARAAPKESNSGHEQRSDPATASQTTRTRLWQRSPRGAERLKPNLVWMAEHLTNHDELGLSPGLLPQLESISTATVGRNLQRLRQDEHHLPRKGPVESERLAAGLFWSVDGRHPAKPMQLDFLTSERGG